MSAPVSTPPAPPPSPLRPRTIDEVVEAVRANPKVHPVGAGTKPALAAPPAGYTPLSLTALSGIVEYDPGEFTITALAGTRVAAIEAALTANGQYLPFDPPFGDAGATLGGTLGAGLSGPGRQRYGGVRDFILGIRFVTGAGELVRGGGKVVKNAAGFDFPKLFVGSLGRLGPVVEATCRRSWDGARDCRTAWLGRVRYRGA
jgi:glycolate oxidase FAD binding subunit